MKNFNKIFGIAIVVVAIMFSIVGCKMDNDDNELLNGVWDRGDIVVTFNNSTAVFSQINSDSGWIKVQNNGSIRIGDQKFRNITKKGDLTWTGQERTYDQDTYLVKGWEDSTITMDSSGKTLQVYTPNITNPYTTYTKK
ncbi:hypothetical protein FACS1894151_10890 [Spirochaetia bacterium]|nr:hypothetical protein FACS1894151_10890 [Spirochaetia bacterium]